MKKKLRAVTVECVYVQAHITLNILTTPNATSVLHIYILLFNCKLLESIAVVHTTNFLLFVEGVGHNI